MKIVTLGYGDNFIYLLLDGQRAAVVDPGAAAPVLEAIKAHEAALDFILLTHHHGDHTGGCSALKRATGCRVAGPSEGSVPIESLVNEGTPLAFSGRPITVMAVPGHTAHDVAYFVPGVNAVFTGDTLFAGGCGRLFGADAATMWASLCRLRALPDETCVYGGHDYTLDNLQFAADLEPHNAAVAARLRQHLARGSVGPSAPSTIAEERLTNPFFRCDTPELMATVKLPHASPAAVFAEVRRRKDRW